LSLCDDAGGLFSDGGAFVDGIEVLSEAVDGALPVDDPDDTD
jgi:hypothetical protein